PGDRVADGDAHAHGWAVGVTDEFAEARVAFGHGRETGSGGHGTGLAECGDADEDEFRVGLLEDVRAQPPLLQGAGTEVLEQDVRTADEFDHGLAPLFGAQVEFDGLLIAIDRAVEHRGRAGLEPPIADLVACLRAFDLDHLGAEVGECEESHNGEGKSVPAHVDAPSRAWFGPPIVPGVGGFGVDIRRRGCSEDLILPVGRETVRGWLRRESCEVDAVFEQQLRLERIPRNTPCPLLSGPSRVSNTGRQAADSGESSPNKELTWNRTISQATTRTVRTTSADSRAGAARVAREIGRAHV